MKHNKTHTIISCIAVAAFIFTGCAADGTQGDSTSDYSERDPHNPETNVVDATHFWGDVAIGYMYAAEEGIAEDYGLEMSSSPMQDSTNAMTQLVGGEKHLATTNYFSLANALSQGMDLKIIAEIFRSGPDDQIAYVREDSGIESLADLAGKEVAVSTLNGLNDMRMKFDMQEQGLDWESVNFVQLPYGEMANSLAMGNVDAVVSRAEYYAAVEDAVDTRQIWDGVGETFDGGPMMGWVVSGSWAAENPNTVAALQCSILEGQKALNQDDELFGESMAEYIEANETAINAVLDADTSFVEDDYDVEGIQQHSEVLTTVADVGEEIDLAGAIIPYPENC